MKKELKKKFAFELLFANKRGDVLDIEPKALFDEIAKQWIVGVYYKQGGKLMSFVLAEGLTEKEANKVVKDIIKTL